MEQKFWLDKWVNNQIGFHRNEYSTHLEKHWKHFASDSGTVFAPLCGKSLDMLFFNEKGHKVYGCEISPIAVESFFHENKIPFKKEGQLYFCDDLFIYCEDIFKLNAADFKNVSYIYDRASMIALPPAMRSDYINWLQNTFPATPIFLETLTFDNDEIGPPFSISEEKVRLAYSEKYQVKLVEQVEAFGVHQDKISQCYSNIFFIYPK